MPNSKTISGNESLFKMRKMMEKQSDEINKRVNLWDSNEGTKEESISQVLSRIEEKLDSLERRLDLIFKDHVLINGVWNNKLFNLNKCKNN